jgi:hypothetical protein
MDVCYSEKNDATQPSRGRSNGGDAGSGEIVFGVMSLGYFLVGYLGQRWEIDSLLLMLMIVVPALGICYRSSRVIQRRVLQPVIERATHAIPASTQALIGYVNHRWTLIVLMALIWLVAACIAVFVGGSNLENTWNSLMVRILGFGLFLGLVGGYGFWIVFNGQQEHAWKWAVMALGFLMVGLPVHGNIFAVWTETALLNGIVWFGSGLATLYFYTRRTRRPDVNQE